MWPFKRKREPDGPQAEAESIASSPASEGPPPRAEVVAAGNPSQPEPTTVDDGGQPAIPVYCGALSPINGVVSQLVEGGEEVDFSQPEVVRISKRPKWGTDAYAVLLFSPVTEETIARYETIHSASIPGAYRDVLLALSGASVFKLKLYGVPPSMAQNPPLLDRSRAQPLDIATANRSWRWAFTPDPAGLHFGDSPWSYEEQMGYFLFPDGSVRGFLRGRPQAKPEPVRQAGSWPSLEAFLAEELERCRRLCPELEERAAQAEEAYRREARAKRSSRRKPASE